MALETWTLISQIFLAAILVVLPALLIETNKSWFGTANLFVLITLSLLLVTVFIVSFHITKYYFYKYYPWIVAGKWPELPPKVPKEKTNQIWSFCYWWSAILSVIVVAAIFFLFSKLIHAFVSNYLITSIVFSFAIITVFNFTLSFFISLRLHYLAHKQKKNTTKR